MKCLVPQAGQFSHAVIAILFGAACLSLAPGAQNAQREEEIVANLAGGRIIVHVARDSIIFAAIDQPIEANSIPPLVVQLHHKIEIAPDEPLLQLVIIGFAPMNYGPEVWVVEYRIEQEQISTRGEYWQTRVLRPRFTQLYPPEKHALRTPVETRFPPNLKGPTLLELIQGNDPRFARLGAAEPRFARVLEAIEKGQAQKAVPADAADFLRAALPVMAPDARFVLATMEEQRGFEWIVPPDEPIEKAKKDDKNRPPEAPTLRRKPQP